jgi:hypothetical protein
MLLHSITAITVKAVETVVLGILNVFSGNTNRREKLSTVDLLIRLVFLIFKEDK